MPPCEDSGYQSEQGLLSLCYWHRRWRLMAVGYQLQLSVTWHPLRIAGMPRCGSLLPRADSTRSFFSASTVADEWAALLLADKAT